MAVLTHLETDTGTNVDISGATAVGAYTSTGDKLIMVDVSIDAVAGNGDYVMYVTRQIGGSGSAYRILPQTTMTAASGLTAISGQSGWITVRNGDVLTCYVDGLAGDTSTPDWSTRWYELAGVTAAAVADAVLDEATSGHTSAGSFSKAVTDILADTGTDGVVLKAAGLNADAVAEIQSGLALEATLTAIKGAGWGTETLAEIHNLLSAGFNGSSVEDTVYAAITPIFGAGWTVDGNLKNIWAAAASANYFAEDAAEWGRVIANPTTGELFAVRDAILAAIEAIDGGGSSMTPEQIRAAVGLALANLDTQLSGLLTAINSIETDVDLTGIAKTTDVESAKDEVLTAIDDKPVTPVTDISNLATKLDLDVLAKAADLDELLTMLTTVANDTGTTVPQLVASLPAKVWSYPFRTLTVSAIRPQTLLEGDQFSIYKDTSILIPITALGDISAYDNLWFTAKKEMDLQDGDEKAIIHIDLLTGLLYINQEVADNALGGIRIDDSEAGNIDIWLSKNASALLPLFSKETLRWEVKGISGDNVDILLQGTNYILPAVTRKIS